MGNATQGKQTAVIMGKNPDDENAFLRTDNSGNLSVEIHDEVTVEW